MALMIHYFYLIYYLNDIAPVPLCQKNEPLTPSPGVILGLWGAAEVDGYFMKKGEKRIDFFVRKAV